MWKLLIIATLCSVGCLDTESLPCIFCYNTAWDMPQAAVHPVADDDSHQDAWDDAVADAIYDWNSRLQARGCQPPFIMSNDSSGYPVRLVLRARWDDAQHVGFEYADHIEVRSALDNSPPRGGALRHELGHAIGLQHTDPMDGPSIMTPISAPSIFPRDVEAAAALLGC